MWTVQVVLYTGYHNATRCFEETLDRGKAQAWNTPVPFNLSPIHTGRRRASWIKVHGAWLPRQISGHFHAPFAYARALWTAVSENLVAALSWCVVSLLGSNISCVSGSTSTIWKGYWCYHRWPGSRAFIVLVCLRHQIPLMTLNPLKFHKRGRCPHHWSCCDYFHP